MQVKFLIHQKFKDRLKEIDSPITKAFLELKKIDNSKDNYRNYINVSFDNKSLVSFLDKRKENLLGENLINLSERKRLEPGDEAYVDKFVYTKYFHKDSNTIQEGAGFIPYPYIGYNLKVKYKPNGYSNIEGCSLINYIPNYYLYPVKPRYIKNNTISEVWDPNKRLKSKIGKLVQTLFPNKFTEKEIEYFTLAYQKQGLMECGMDNAFYKIYSGNDIKYAYHEENYIENCKGELISSCMRYDSCQDYFNIYTENTRQVELLAIVDTNEKIRARCILWYPEGKESIKYHDRIYFHTTEDRTFMEIYLQNNGYKDVFNDKNWKEVTFTLDSGFNSDWKYPYMDSFKYIDTNGVISTYESKNYCLTFTDGQYQDSEDDENYCDHCGESCEELNEIIAGGRRVGDYVCTDCSTYCEDVEGYVINDYTSCSDYDNCSYLDDNTVYSDNMGSYIHIDDAIRLYNDEYTHKDENPLKDVNGNYFLEDDDNFIEIDDVWYNTSNYTIVQDNEGNDQLEENCVEIEGTYYLKSSEEIEFINDEYKLKEHVEQ